MGHKEILVDTIESCLKTIQDGGHHSDPVVKTFAGRIASLKTSLTAARAITGGDAIGVLEGMSRQAGELQARYLDRIDKIYHQKFLREDRWFRRAEVAILVASTVTAVIAAWSSVGIGKKSIEVSERQAAIMEKQVENQEKQDASKTDYISKVLFESKISEIESNIQKLAKEKSSRGKKN